MQKPWSLYNKEEKLRIDDLKSEQVRIILLAIPTSQMQHWYACQEGNIHWLSISAIPEFYEDVRQIKGKDPFTPQVTAAPLPEVAKKSDRRPLFEEAPVDEMKTGATLNIESADTKERRSARRYQRRISFEARKGGKSFSSFTMDVSMAGLSLADPLPDWLPASFNAELSMNGKSARISCEKVSDTKLKLLNSDSWELIRLWIVSW